MTFNEFYDLKPGDMLFGHNNQIAVIVLDYTGVKFPDGVHTEIAYVAEGQLSSWRPGAAHFIFEEYRSFYTKIDHND